MKFDNLIKPAFIACVIIVAVYIYGCSPPKPPPWFNIPRFDPCKIYEYSPDNDSYTHIGKQAKFRGIWQYSLVFDNKVYSLLGRQDTTSYNRVHKAVEMFDPATSNSSVVTSIPEEFIQKVESVLVPPASIYTCYIDNQDIRIIGKYYQKILVLEYNIPGNSWTPMQTSTVTYRHWQFYFDEGIRSRAGMGNLVFEFGANSPYISNKVYELNLSTQISDNVAELPFPTGVTCAQEHNGIIFLFAGDGVGGLGQKTAMFDPASYAIVELTPPPFYFVPIVSVSDGASIYLFSHYNWDSLRAYRYDVAADTWTRIADVPAPVASAAYADGRIFIFTY